MATVSIRYIVDDVDAAIAFYCQHLGFREQMHPAPAFAMLSRGDLRLLLSAAGGTSPGGGSAAMPVAERPSPEAGTDSRSKSTISKQPLKRCARWGPGSATTSSPASAASRFCSTTHRAIPSNCSSPPSPRPSSDHGLDRPSTRDAAGRRCTFTCPPTTPPTVCGSMPVVGQAQRRHPAH